MTTADSPLAAPPVHTDSAEGARRSSLPAWEAWLERAGEQLNPILIKEARQALKSRQFVLTFTLLLICAWGWSLLGIMSLSPQVYYTPGGRFMLMGYYFVLAIPLLVVVPFAAFRSLAAEREDGTFELLSITSLSSRQIITGKLGSAVLQMLVYYSALSPCIAFTYLLRGLDIVTIALVLSYTFCVSLLLACVGLLVATATRSLAWQVLLSVLLLGGLLLATIIWSQFVVMFLMETPPLDDTEFWVANLAGAMVYASFVVLIVLAAAGQISFASDNRSTRLRAVMVVQQVIWVGWMIYAWARTEAEEALLIMFCFAAGYWMFMGALLSGEWARLSPRVRRQLPHSFLGRMTLTWFNPGSGSGYVFAVANMLALVAVGLVGGVISDAVGFGGKLEWKHFAFLLLTWAYVTIYLGCCRLMFLFLRRLLPVGIVVSLLLNAFVIAAGAILPFFADLWLRDFSRPEYSWLQLPNWAWTLGETLDDGLTGYTEIVFAVLMMAGGVLLVNFVLAVREVEQTRQETPERVLEDMHGAARAKAAPVVENPFE